MSRREAGQIIIIMAFGAFALFAIVGLAIDAGRLYITKAELSRAVDSAALSGILEFNGTSTGLTNGKVKAREYFDENEPGPGLNCPAAPVCREVKTSLEDSDIDDNEMVVEASKTVDLLFMRVLGIPTATVSAHAKAGFGTQFLDTVMVLDATPSMAGNPIEQAVIAAGIFKDIILGTNPEGNASVGVTAFRGCFRPSPINDNNECVKTTGSDRWLQTLTYNHSTLDGVLSNIDDASGGASVGTNVCTGLAMGWNLISDTSLNHANQLLYPDSQQYMVLLSDGDNYYPGQNVYRDPYYTGTGAYNSSSSPTGTTVGSTVFPCQPIDNNASAQGAACTTPWNNPAIGSTYPCYKGVFAPASQAASDNFDGPSNNCPSTWNSGSGIWVGSWVTSSSPAPSALGNDTDANDTRCHIRLGGTASICRAVNLTAVAGGTVYFYLTRSNNWESSDDFHLDASTSTNACTNGGASWTTLEDINRGSIDVLDDYNEFDASLDAYGGQTVYIRFQGSTDSTSEYVYLDTIEVWAGSTGSQDGYLNGPDTSSPTNCNTQQKPRERQLDVRTLALANAIKSQGVTVYVVAFAGGVANCYLNQDVSYDWTDPNDCGLITANSSYPIGASGPDGYTNSALSNPNVRLLRCIASSDDHYFYADDASDLQGIFTQIATQISHRLIE